MAAEVSSTLVRSVPDEATSSCPEPDYSAKKTASCLVEEDTQTSCVLMQEMKR